MGKHSTYRKRGSAGPVFTELGSPPAPLEYFWDGDLAQSATGEDDTGGFCRLYFSGAPGGPFTLYSATPWESVINWSAVANPEPGYYRCTEVGNGIAYSGESAPSNVLHVD